MTPTQVPKEIVDRLQAGLNKLMASAPEPFPRYAREHKLKLLDSRLAILDRALDAGLIEIKEASN